MSDTSGQSTPWAEDLRGVVEESIERPEEEDFPESPFIGVRGDFMARGPVNSPYVQSALQSQPTPPRYRKGDEQLFAGASLHYIVALQSALLSTGLLGIGDINAQGSWGKNEEKAMREIMHMANTSGQTWEQVAAFLAQQGDFRSATRGSRGSGASARRFVPRKPNRAEVKRSYRAIRRQSLGGQFDGSALEEEAEAFANTWEAQVVGAQRAAFDGRPVEEAPSLEAAALDKLEAERESDINAFSFAGLARAMIGALG